MDFRACTLLTNTIAPPSGMSFAASCAPKKVPRALAFITASQSSGVVFRTESPTPRFAALETKASSRPNRAATASMAVCAEAESEIARLESEGEKAAFLDALGIAEPAVDALARLCLSALGLVSFFTAESRELRQWLLRSGSTAPAAAGVIHSDMERGFIRAEVMKYADLDALGGEAEVRGAGKALLKGREYVVEDGDILAIRFSV